MAGLLNPVFGKQPFLVRTWVILFASMMLGNISQANEAVKVHWKSFNQPCDGQCSVSFFAGPYVNDSMTSIFLQDFTLPWQWSYAEDYIAGIAVSRRLVSFFSILHIEPEIGVAQRFGEQNETEIWAATYFRYSAFPWNDYLYTTVAVSTGLSYASGISAKEAARGGPAGGSRLLHYLSPEVTFARPDNPGKSLVFRFQHRSGAYGLVSNSGGGAHYGTVGLRLQF